MGREELQEWAAFQLDLADSVEFGLRLGGWVVGLWGPEWGWLFCTVAPRAGPPCLGC